MSSAQLLHFNNVGLNMKRTLALSILIVFITTSFMSLAGCNKERSSVSKKQLKEDKEQLELQNKCGKISKDFFWKNYNANDHYRYHYNKKLNQCLMVTTETGVLGRKKELLDAYENNTYGIIRINKEKKVTTCDVLKKICTTEEEWDSFVKPYMEE